MKNIKTKFFIIGFFTSLLICVITIVSIVKYFQYQRTQSIDEELKVEYENLQIKTLLFDSNSYKSLFFTDISTNEKIFVEKERFLFVNFWATWCEPCVSELPDFEKLVNNPQIKKLPIQFIFSSEESNEKILKFLEKKKMNLTFCKQNNKLPKLMDFKSIPTSYIIDTKNNIAYQFDGIQNWNSELITNFLKSLN